ncbi:hypothetical protein CPB86DRAFT_677966, partial [Serendipita vermifera]
MYKLLVILSAAYLVSAAPIPQSGGYNTGGFNTSGFNTSGFNTIGLNWPCPSGSLWGWNIPC